MAAVPVAAYTVVLLPRSKGRRRIPHLTFVPARLPLVLNISVFGEDQRVVHLRRLQDLAVLAVAVRLDLVASEATTNRCPVRILRHIMCVVLYTSTRSHIRRHWCRQPGGRKPGHDDNKRNRDPPPPPPPHATPAKESNNF